MKKKNNLIKSIFIYTIVSIFCITWISCKDKKEAKSTETAVVSEPVYEEVSGLLSIEAEDFYKQTLDNKRKWYITSQSITPNVKPDSDTTHINNVSGGAYVEVLPDSRHTHDDILIHGENFADEPGAIAILHYKVHFNTTGRYYVWIRAYSSNSEDDAVHLGIDGNWPETGKRWRSLINDEWGWQCKRRNPTEDYKGEPLLSYIDIEKSGPCDLQISMREDGAEMDKIVLTLDKDFIPENLGPTPKTKSSK